MNISENKTFNAEREISVNINFFCANS